MKKLIIQTALSLGIVLTITIAQASDSKAVKEIINSIEGEITREYTVSDFKSFGNRALESIKDLPAAVIKINETMMHDAKYGEPIDQKLTDGKASVHSVAGGTVKEIGNNQDIGKYVIIQHGEESESTYGNLSEITCTLNERVKKREIIGVYVQDEDMSDNNEEKNFYYALNYFD